jgi:hypothetical protein
MTDREHEQETLTKALDVLDALKGVATAELAQGAGTASQAWADLVHAITDAQGQRWTIEDLLPDDKATEGQRDTLQALELERESDDADADADERVTTIVIGSGVFTSTGAAVTTIDARLTRPLLGCRIVGDVARVGGSATGEVLLVQLQADGTVTERRPVTFAELAAQALGVRVRAEPGPVKRDISATVAISQLPEHGDRVSFTLLLLGVPEGD